MPRLHTGQFEAEYGALDSLVSTFDQSLNVCYVAVRLVHVFVVGDVVAEIKLYHSVIRFTLYCRFETYLRTFKERTDPQASYAQLLDVVELAQNARQIAWHMNQRHIRPHIVPN